MLFLQSLEYGSYFNVCSYGSEHNFMFKNGSVEYNEVNLQHAIDLIQIFEADLGGTEIYQPLDEIFKQVS